MNIDLMMAWLLIVAVLTSLATQATKATAGDKIHRSNIIALVWSAIISVATGLIYGYTVSGFDVNLIIFIVCLVFLSWLCAMLGYDKVLQALTQLRDAKADVVECDETDDEEAKG